VRGEAVQEGEEDERKEGSGRKPKGRAIGGDA